MEPNTNRATVLKAAITLHFAYYNFCRVYSSIKTTPAIKAGLTDHVWSVAELIETALKAVPPRPTPLQHRKSFRVIQGDPFD